ncbi:MAG: sugar phosphate isomerase/epimerase [Pseudomonadota bacterium]|nr:sugar phosphate isomerase/epimerase [Pseudomonadota bacterium]
MLLGFNLLYWTGHVTDEHAPLLATLKQVGYDGVELPIFEGTPEHFSRIGKRISDNGLRCTAVTVMPDPSRDCASADPKVRQAALGHIKWAVDCLAAAGGELLCGPFHQPLGVFSGEPPTREERSHVAEVHREAAAYAGKRGIKLSIEPLNRFECYVFNTVADAADLVREVGQPNYGLLYDTFHTNIEEKDPVGVIAPHLDRINHVHLSENDRGTPGKGHVPWLPTLQALKRGGYQGWFAIEAFGRALPALAAATRVWRDL